MKPPSCDAKKKNVSGWIVLSAILSVMMFIGRVEARLVEFQGQTLDIAMPGEVIPNQIVVVAESPSARKGIHVLAGETGATVLRNAGNAGIYLFEVAEGPAKESALQAINNRHGFYHAYPNYKMSIPAPPEIQRHLFEEMNGTAAEAKPGKSSFPADGVTAQYSTNDPGVSSQYWLWKIREPYCPTPAAASKGIAVIDTGVDYNHPDLSGKVVSVFDYVGWDTDTMDENGHGTHCAGIAAANADNGMGIRGVSPNSKIYAYRVLNAFGSGSFFDVYTAIRAAADHTGVRILVLNLAGYLAEGTSAFSDFKAAVDYAVSTKKKIVVVAAGNEGNQSEYYYVHEGLKYRPVPAWYGSSFTVGATNEADYRTNSSNYDVSSAKSADGTATYTWSFVDIVAPGHDVLSTYPGDQYRVLSGTSAAASLAAGACARLWDHNPKWTGSQVTARLQTTGRVLAAEQGFPVSEKRVDLFKAIAKSTVKGGFQGRILNGETGLPLGDVKVEALAGTKVAETVSTNRAGFFTLSNLSSTVSYSLRLSKSDYLTRKDTQGKPPAGDIKDLSVQFVAPSRAGTSTDANWRIIVSWKSGQPGYSDAYYDNTYGDYPYYPYHYYNAAGMEANAYLRAPDGSTYGWSNTGWLSASPYVAFLHDSYGSTPIESHVVRKQTDGIYTYYLSLDPDDWCWGAIRYAPGTPSYPMYPVVTVYKGDTLKATINAGSAVRVGTGTQYWHVFNLSGDTLTAVNKIQDTQP